MKEGIADDEIAISAGYSSKKMTEVELADVVANELQLIISTSVEKYMNTVDFKDAVESFKLIKRKEMLSSIEAEINMEKQVILKQAKLTMMREVEEEVDLHREKYVSEYVKSLLEKERSAEDILLLNRIKMQNKQQESINEKLSSDQVRLMEIMRKKDMVSNKEKLEEPVMNNFSISITKDTSSTAATKVRFGLKRSNPF